MRQFLKSLTAHLPERWRHDLRRIYFRRLIHTGRFRSTEPEYELLVEFVSEGDWVLDIGANVGHYAVRLSELVGAQGRVVAVEPVPDTADILSSNLSCGKHRNATVLAVAASDSVRSLRMQIPLSPSGVSRYYQAQVTDDAGGFEVLGLPIDALSLPRRVTLVKIDAEGHDLAVLKGMAQLLARDKPILIVEDSSLEIRTMLSPMGYKAYRLSGSHNLFLDSRGTVPKVLSERSLSHHSLD